MHWKTPALLVTVSIMAGSSLLALAGDDAAVKKDRKALQGTWKTNEDNKAGIRSMKFEGDKVVVTFKSDETAAGTVTIDPAQKPKTIDIKVTKGSGDATKKYEGKTSKGLYELDGNKLKWLANEPGNDERPKAFPADGEEPKALYLVFERAKK